jgi:hypothetical protein
MQCAFRGSPLVLLPSDRQCPHDQTKNEVAFRKDVPNRVGVGFDVPASLASIEPNEPKIEVAVEETEVKRLMGLTKSGRGEWI